DADDYPTMAIDGAPHGVDRRLYAAQRVFRVAPFDQARRVCDVAKKERQSLALATAGDQSPKSLVHRLRDQVGRSERCAAFRTKTTTGTVDMAASKAGRAERLAARGTEHVGGAVVAMTVTTKHWQVPRRSREPTAEPSAQLQPRSLAWYSAPGERDSVREHSL